MRKAELLATLNQFLVEQYAAGRKVLLIVDEAQNLSNRVLEEIRLLSGVETTKDKVLRIILAGQPELSDRLNSAEMIQLVQRVRLRFHLTALSPEDTQAYVLHRLEVAGSHGRKIFADDTYPIIFRYTGGVPRLINTLCDTALMGAYALEQTQIGIGELKAAIEELQWVEFAARTNRMREVLAVAPAPRLVGPGEVLARIIVAHSGEHVEERPLRVGRMIIGRTPDNDLQIDSKFISRHHCQIITTTEGGVLEDLNSTNGVYVKSKRVRKHHLNDGDVIVLGKHEIMYLDERSVRGRVPQEADPTGDHEVVDEDQEEDEVEDKE
jgi:hypothetical protein